MYLHFEITFVTVRDTEDVHQENSEDEMKEFRRVIIADDMEMAEKIAAAMLGEEVAGNQRLECVANIRFTSQQATMGIFSEAKEIWEQVLAKLEIDPLSVDCLHITQYGVKEIVGFIKKKGGLK